MKEIEEISHKYRMKTIAIREFAKLILGLETKWKLVRIAMMSPEGEIVEVEIL